MKDVRFPLIHYPPALENYVKTLKPKKKVILVLTKTDLVPPYIAEGWRKCLSLSFSLPCGMGLTQDGIKGLEEKEGPEGAEVVLMESYKETERSILTQGFFLFLLLPSCNSLIRTSYRHPTQIYPFCSDFCTTLSPLRSQKGPHCPAHSPSYCSF